MFIIILIIFYGFIYLLQLQSTHYYLKSFIIRSLTQRNVRFCKGGMYKPPGQMRGRVVPQMTTILNKSYLVKVYIT